MHRSHASWKVL